MERLSKKIIGVLASHPALWLLIGTALIFLLILCLGLPLAEDYSRNISGEITRELLAKCGQISFAAEENGGTLPPETLAGCWAERTEETSLIEGTEIMEPYGYSLTMDETCNPYYRPIKKKLTVGLLIFSGGVAAASFLLGLLILLAVNRQLSGLTGAAEKILEEADGEFPQNSGGAIGRLTAVVKQYAERTKRLLAALAEEKVRMKDFLSDISHQMKTPAAVLKLNHELMLSDPEMELSEREDFLKRDLVQLDRMEWLLAGLLKLARLEAGAVEYDLKPHAISRTVDCVFDSFRQTAKNKGVCLVNRIPEDLVFSYDEDWMQEAVGNLVKNALEHCKEAGGEILCKGSGTPMTAELSVTDNGQGIPPEELPHIFDRFYSKKGAVNPQGAGIGLSLAAKIFEAFDGKIRAASDGNGTSFTVCFLTKM